MKSYTFIRSEYVIEEHHEKGTDADKRTSKDRCTKIDLWTADIPDLVPYA